MEKSKVVLITKILCLIFLIIGIIMLVLGFGKKNNYNNPDNEYTFNDDYINSYVGGDAYNYIINGTYFTGYVVVGTGFLIMATIVGCMGLYLSIDSNKQGQKEKRLEDIKTFIKNTTSNTSEKKAKELEFLIDVDKYTLNDLDNDEIKM